MARKDYATGAGYTGADGHTTGPWQVSSGMVETVSGVPIAHMDRTAGNGTLPVNRDANAYLIAKAPELRAELMPDELDQLAMVLAETMDDLDVRRLEGLIEWATEQAMKHRALLATLPAPASAPVARATGTRKSNTKG
jgi:hypothetical protein